MNGVVVKKFLGRPQEIEHSRQYLLFRTDILEKTVVGCPRDLSLYFGSLYNIWVLASEQKASGPCK